MSTTGLREWKLIRLILPVSRVWHPLDENIIHYFEEWSGIGWVTFLRRWKITRWRIQREVDPQGSPCRSLQMSAHRLCLFFSKWRLLLWQVYGMGWLVAQWQLQLWALSSATYWTVINKVCPEQCCWLDEYRHVQQILKGRDTWSGVPPIHSPFSSSSSHPT